MNGTPTLVTGTVLDRIVARTRADLEARKRSTSRDALRERIEQRTSPVDFEGGLRGEHVAVIAEIKRASPSRGWFPVEVDPASVAADYVEGGASAISCLTDESFFHGSLGDLEIVVEQVRAMDGSLGVLRKDFMIDTFQIDEARAAGASCILLIAAMLEDALLRELFSYASARGMSALVEVHDETELDHAIAVGASLIGINNRNLKTLDIDLGVTERLAPLAPPEATLVGESGISGNEDVERMASAGVDAVLVGESLIMHPLRVEALKTLSRVPRRPRDDS